MKLEGTILCLGEESKFEVYWNDVVVYPTRVKGGPEEDGTGVLQVGGALKLPGYEEHDRKEKHVQYFRNMNNSHYDAESYWSTFIQDITAFNVLKCIWNIK